MSLMQVMSGKPMRVLFLILLCYVVVNVIHYKYRYEALSRLCGGKWMKGVFLMIPIGYITIAMVQHRAGCEHLWAECYKDTLPSNWLIMKDLFSLMLLTWLGVFLYRAGMLGIRAVCRYWKLHASHRD